MHPIMLQVLSGGNWGPYAGKFTTNNVNTSGSTSTSGDAAVSKVPPGGDPTVQGIGYGCVPSSTV